MRALFAGVVCIDVIDKVERYPEEDASVRVLERRRSVGGNAANASV